jgi:hypothetical protein|tara:strand:+ start:425 stop:946 length:522 start_codon:yes stop_codon:yes gene_type:complete
MDTSLYVENYINKLNELNEKNIKEFDYKLKEKLPIKETKEIISYKEMKDFTDSRKKYYQQNTNFENEEHINIFENNIIKTDEIELNFYDLPFEKKMDNIFDYMKRKKIKLNCDMNIINDIVNDNALLKKYISIDKTYNIINKVSFFKKLENGDYNIVLENSNKRTKKKFFTKK